MSLFPAEIAERANNVLRGPLTALVVKPDVMPSEIEETCETLLNATIDLMHVIGSSLEVQAECGVDGKAVARLIWLHGNLLELYAALRGEPRP
jgi:hypothetical protein